MKEVKVYLHIFIPDEVSFPAIEGMRFFKNALTSSGIKVIGVLLGVSSTPRIEITYQGGLPRDLINNLKTDFTSALRNFTKKGKVKVVFKKL